MKILILTAMLLVAGADHDHDHGIDESSPELSRQAVVAPIFAARKVSKQQRLTALRIFADKVTAAAQDDATLVLKAELERNLADVETDRFVLTYAAEQEPFEIASLAEARDAYFLQLQEAGDAYNTAVKAALKNDDHGYIGDMMMAELDHSIDTDLMWHLMDYYWHHGHLDDPPASFQRTILMSYRFVQLEPQSPAIYNNAAWLLWSRWVSWKRDPENRQRGEGDDERAHQFLLEGRKTNATDPEYHFDAAMTLWGLANYHDKKYFDFVRDSLLLADQYATETKLQMKVRLMLGHTYRVTGKTELARKAYQRVLEVDPDYEVAKLLIQELDAPTPPPAP